MKLEELLRAAVEQKASDLHLKSGAPPRLRVDGELCALPGAGVIAPEELVAIAGQLMGPAHQKHFRETREADFACTIEGVGRVRVNVYQQRGAMGIALRMVPSAPRGIDELDLPPVIERLCHERRGLILVTGTTGSGKSTTLAAIVDRINALRSDHILTIEDPIEYLHTDKLGVVNQREIAVDTSSFAVALRAALRQDPDVILVGEMRDLETIHTALVAAETGHLVLSTLHTLDAAETIQRIISNFPEMQQRQIRLQLASVLRAVISQRLVPRCDHPGRIPAVEVLVSTAFVRDCIVNPEKTALLRDAIAKGGSQYGMQTFDQSLYNSWQQKKITYETALVQASNPDEFKLRALGVSSGGMAPATVPAGDLDRGF